MAYFLCMAGQELKHCEITVFFSIFQLKTRVKIEHNQCHGTTMGLENKN